MEELRLNGLYMLKVHREKIHHDTMFDENVVQRFGL